MAGMWNRQQSMWKGRGGSSLPECCYSGPHSSASVSANERNWALFHLVSLDQELASPKTEGQREGGGRKREGEPQRNGRGERGVRWKISVIDRNIEGGEWGRGDWLLKQGCEYKHKLSVSRPLTHMLQHIDKTELSEVAECETALNRSLMDPRDERPAAQHRGGWVGGGAEGHRSEVSRSLRLPQSNTTTTGSSPPRLQSA